MTAYNEPVNERAYYARILSNGQSQLDPDSIVIERTCPQNIPSRSTLSRVKVISGDAVYELWEKTRSRRGSGLDHPLEFDHADAHEAAVLRGIASKYPPRGANRNYEVATLLDRRVSEDGDLTTLVTEDVGGLSLSDVIIDLNHYIRGAEQERDRATRTRTRNYHNERATRLRIVKSGYLTAAVEGMADLVFDLRSTYREPIIAELLDEARGIGNGGIGIFNPLTDTDDGNQYYERRFCRNLELALHDHVPAGELRTVLKVLRRRVDKSHPLHPITSLLRKHTKPAEGASSGSIILSDAHPREIHCQPTDPSLERLIQQYVQTGSMRTIEGQDVQRRIANDLTMSVVDCGDLRVGHELLDFCPLVGHHSLNLRWDQVHKYLGIWAQRTGKLVQGAYDTHAAEATLRKALPPILLYKRIHAAAKEPEPPAREFYVREANTLLSATSGLQQLRTLLQPLLVQAYTSMREKHKRTPSSSAWSRLRWRRS